MKKLMLLLIQFVCMVAPAQTIYNDGEKWVLVFPSGKRALQDTYDRIELTSRNSYQDLFICVNDNKFGLYNFTDSTFTGCIYDSVYVDRSNIVIIVAKKKLGFVGYDHHTGKYQVVPPAYDAVYWIGKDISAYDSSGILIKNFHAVTVRIDSLWGLVSCTDGSPLLDVKYRFPIECSLSGPFFTCIDRRNEQQTLINPLTRAEFRMAFLAHITWCPQWNIIYAVDDFGKVMAEVKAWSYDTGTELFTYTTTANDVKLRIYTDQIFSISESFDDDESRAKNEQYVYTFWNVSNGSKLLSCTGTFRDELIVRQEPRKLIVWMELNGNYARTKLIGEIYK